MLAKLSWIMPKKIIALMNEMTTTLSDMTNLQHGSIHIGIPTDCR